MRFYPAPKDRIRSGTDSPGRLHIDQSMRDILVAIERVKEWRAAAAAGFGVDNPVLGDFTRQQRPRVAGTRDRLGAGDQIVRLTHDLLFFPLMALSGPPTTRMVCGLTVLISDTRRVLCSQFQM